MQHKEQSNKESVENPVYAGRGNCMYTHMRICMLLDGCCGITNLLLTSENMNTQIQAGVIVCKLHIFTSHVNYFSKK